MKLKENMINEEKGMSIILLILIIAILIAISCSIVIYFKKQYNDTQIEDIQTNMYTLNTTFLEVLNSNVHKNEPLVGNKIEEPSFELQPNEVLYEITDEQAEELNLNLDVSNFLVIYNVIDKKTDIIYKNGIEIGDVVKYRLSEMEGQNEG